MLDIAFALRYFYFFLFRSLVGSYHTYNNVGIAAVINNIRGMGTEGIIYQDNVAISEIHSHESIFSMPVLWKAISSMAAGMSASILSLKNFFIISLLIASFRGVFMYGYSE